MQKPSLKFIIKINSNQSQFILHCPRKLCHWGRWWSWWQISAQMEMNISAIIYQTVSWQIQFSHNAFIQIANHSYPQQSNQQIIPFNHPEFNHHFKCNIAKIPSENYLFFFSEIQIPGYCIKGECLCTSTFTFCMPNLVCLEK